MMKKANSNQDKAATKGSLKLKAIIGSTMVLFAIAFACSSGTKSPSAAASELAKNMQKGNYKVIVDNMYFDSETASAEEIKQQKEMFLGLMEEKGAKTIEEKGGIKKYEMLGENITDDGKKATVEIKYTYGNGTAETETENFILADGKWLYHINK